MKSKKLKKQTKKQNKKNDDPQKFDYKCKLCGKKTNTTNAKVLKKQICFKCRKKTKKTADKMNSATKKAMKKPIKKPKPIKKKQTKEDMKKEFEKKTMSWKEHTDGIIDISMTNLLNSIQSALSDQELDKDDKLFAIETLMKTGKITIASLIKSVEIFEKMKTGQIQMKGSMKDMINSELEKGNDKNE